MTVAPGEIISDRYRIVEQLGEGGMGAVFRAEHVHMKKAVAVKVLLGELARHPEIVARFEREAVLAANIEHANIVNATDFGKLPDGTFFLVMEYVAGRSLRAELGTGMPLEPQRAVRIARGILAAIEAAHAKNIVHRDLKPENVMLVERDGDRDFVKVLDFGIAKVDIMTADAGEEPGKKLTRTGAIMGTPEYMAPEQALGQTVDARGDLYSLGIILYEMLTGKPPFHGEPIVIMRRQVLDPPPPLPPEIADALPGIDAILDKLLQKEPANRHADAKELRAALASIGLASSPRISVADLPPPSAHADTAPPVAPVTTKTSEAPRVSRRHVVIGGGALLGLVSIVAIAGAISSTGGASAEPRHPRAAKSAASASSSARAEAPTASASASASAIVKLEDDDDKDDGDGPAPTATVSAAPRPKAGTASTGRRPTQKRKSSGGNVIEDFKKLFK